MTYSPEVRRALYLQNREKQLEQSRARYLANREKRIAQTKERTKNNKEELRAKHLADVEHHRCYQKAWKRNNKEKTKQYESKRRTMKTQAGGYFTSEEWFLLCFAVGFKCLCCGEKQPLTPDHVLPVSKGGTSWLHNIQPLCGPCNSRKKDKYIDYRVNLGEEQLDGNGSRCCTSPEFYSV